MQQEEYDILYNYIQDSKFPQSLTKNKKGALPRKSKKFVVKDDGALYYRDLKNSDLRVLPSCFIKI